MVINLLGSEPPKCFRSPSYTHFYGHGVFSEDGKHLFATENDFENGAGLIGVYYTDEQFKQVYEFHTPGVGPHESMVMPGGRTLCVANGEILTHPDTGRVKLNLHDMPSSVVSINSRPSKLLNKYNVPKALKRLSLRHMDIAADQTVWLGTV